MSIELLISRSPVFHKARHDIESVFFVFIYLCTNLSGPGVPRPLQELQELRSLPIASWFNPISSMERLGADKLSAMALIDQRIIPYFAEYFDDLKPCALDLYRAIYPSFSSLVHPTDISHDAIIQIFDRTLENLPEVDSLPIASLRTPRVRKRSLGIHDNLINSAHRPKKRELHPIPPVLEFVRQIRPVLEFGRPIPPVLGFVHPIPQVLEFVHLLAAEVSNR
jgi:hypothetical protein